MSEPAQSGGETTYLEAIRQAMWEEMERIPRSSSSARTSACTEGR